MNGGDVSKGFWEASVGNSLGSHVSTFFWNDNVVSICGGRCYLRFCIG